METTFMTIHDLSRDANILYASESIVDILGFQPGEVLGRSCFEYFHPDEIPSARRVHERGLVMDRAASLYYAQIMSRDGVWVSCECVFTIVYEVLVACTSIYRGDAKNERRAAEAPTIRRLFASSPRDPRYHMLEHLSAKFRAPPETSVLEPRAALILNRFTRTLTVMYATNAVSTILDITPDQIKDKSFYECIQESCLPEAIRCLESAKANDSIAYLRFQYRDPRHQEDLDEEMREASASSDSEDGGVELTSQPTGMEVDSTPAAKTSTSLPSGQETPGNDQPGPGSLRTAQPHQNKNTSSGESTDLEHDSPDSIFDRPSRPSRISTSTSSELLLVQSEGRQGRRPVPAPGRVVEPREIEAVVSCTSDGLVVVLRRARPAIPSLHQPPLVSQHTRGLFAAPWGANPILPHVHQFNPQYPFRHGLHAPHLPAGGPPVDEFMNSIREVAVFAWSLTGINGNMAAYGHGIPRGESMPPGGLPIWDPFAQPSPGYISPENQAFRKWSRLDEKPHESMAPYQHQQQGKPPSYANGYNGPPAGLDRVKSMGQGPSGNQIAFTLAQKAQAEQIALSSQQRHGGYTATIPAKDSNHVPKQRGSYGNSNGKSTGIW